MNKPPYIVTPSSISIIWEGQPYIISSDNLNFKSLQKVLIDGEYEKIPSFLDIKRRINDFSHGNITIKNEEVYYKEYKLSGVVVDKLIQFLREGMKDATPILNFIEKLMANPSQNSVEQLYTFLSYKVLPLTESGKVIGYKGVRSNYWSINGNKETIVLKGKVDEDGHIYNGVGEEIEVLRRSVDDNKDNHCSRGLHIGSYDYAKGWAGCEGRVMMVEFNPSDAVSVPTDCGFQKLRVCKYKVIGEVNSADKQNAPLNKSYYDTTHEIDVADENYSLIEESDCFYADSTYLAIKNYVENKLIENTKPTLKMIQSRLKGIHITCQEIKDICQKLHFTVKGDSNKISENIVSK